MKRGGENNTREGAAEWVLLTRGTESCRVNGEPVFPAGIRALQDRDEILIGAGARIFYSTEQQATISPFPVSNHER